MTRQSFKAACATIHRDALARQARLNALNLKRAADRAELADALEEVARLHGAEIQRDEGGDYPGPRAIYFSFYLDGAGAHIRIDGDSRTGVPLISWVARDHNYRNPDAKRPDGTDGRCFSSNFETCASAYNQGRPHHKATSCPRSLADLVNDLDGGLGSIACGGGFRHHISAMAAETAWFAAGSPTDRAKDIWIEEYRQTGVRPSESPGVAAAHRAFDNAGGWTNFPAASAAADAAYAAASGVWA